MNLENIGLDWVLFGQSLKMWLLALAVTFGGYALILLARRIAVRRLVHLTQEKERDLHIFLLSCARQLNRFLLLVIVAYAGLQFLTFAEGSQPWLSSIVVIAVILQAALWANEGIMYWFKRYEKQNLAADPSRLTTLRAGRLLMRLFLVAIVILLTLDNIPGVEITALVASLGIGGIAVALALQNILSDLFASLSIVLDKPFVVGDFIIVGDYLGSVENIGMKTTRLRSLSGEQLVFANNDLLSSRIRNYKRMSERRVVFSIGVVYQTPPDKLEKIPSIIRDIIEGLQQTRFDRAHFSSYGDFSLNFEVVYYVLSPDYNVYMDIQQSINLRIYRAFDREEIEFAYPTRTLYMVSDQANEAAATSESGPAADR